MSVGNVSAAKAVLMVKDDLQVIKGIGPFIEEKLFARHYHVSTIGEYDGET